ncbi:hypothetical protein CL658_03830 [bacterium]|nr:hypothetical protein [bacterium]
MKYKHFLGVIGLLLSIFTLKLFAVPTTITTNNAQVIITANSETRFGHSVTFLGTLVQGESPFYAISEPLNKDNGSVYIFQTSDFSTDLSTQNAVVSLNNTTGTNDEFGLFITGGGDVDGDGLDDFIITSPGSGEIKLYLGKGYPEGNNQWTSNDIKTFTSTFLTSHGDGDSKHSASTVSIAGDLNGDGLDDIVIGAPIEDSPNNPSGRVYIVFGSPSLTGGALETNANKIITGTIEADQVGYSVSIINDTNQDGYDELLIGNYDSTPSSEKGYQAYLFYGTWTNFADTSQVTDADAIFYSKSNNNDGSDWFSETVASIGDINDDGYGDFAIGAPNANSNKGKIYLYLGSESKLTHTEAGEDSPIIINATNSYLLGLHGISGGYDYTGDSIADLIINDPNQNSGIESTYIVSGKTSNVNSINLETDESDESHEIYKITHSTTSNDYFSFSTTSGSDISNDGITDLLIGSNILEEVYLFELVTNNRIATANPTEGGTITLYSDETYETVTTTFKVGDWVYIQANTQDPQSSTPNLLPLLVTHNNTTTASLLIQSIETDNDTGIYRDKFKLVRTRTNPFVSQVKANKGQTITIKSPYLETFTTSLTVENSTPTLSQIIAKQVGTGFEDTSIEISYFLQDMDNDIVTIFPEYSINDTNNWQHFNNKSGSQVSNITAIQAYDLGQLRESDSTKIKWTNLSNLNVTMNIRIQVGDGTNTSNIVTLAPLKIDNIAPDSPRFDPPTTERISITKYASINIITANAEAESTVSLFKNKNELAIKTANADSQGIVTFNIEIEGDVGTTQEIYLKATDTVGLTSDWSNTLIIELGPVDLSIDSPFQATATIPYGATENEILSLALTPFTPSSDPPSYLHKAGLSLIGAKKTTGPFDLNCPITVSFPTPLEITDNVKVFYFNPNSLSWDLESTIVITSLSQTSITFYAPYLGHYSIAQHDFPESPSNTSLKINNSTIKDNEYYPSSFTISTILSDDAKLSSYTLSISSSQNDIYKEQKEQNINVTSKDISFEVENLPNGTYTIRLVIIDEHNNQTEQTHTIKIDTSIIIFTNLHGPNPFNPLQTPLIIGTNISIPVDEFAIIIVDQSGNTMWEYHDSNILGGYFTTEWNGYDKNGNIVQNGIYYAYCFMKKNSTTKKERLIIAVLK